MMFIHASSARPIQRNRRGLSMARSLISVVRRCVRAFGHGIVAAGIPGMAASDATRREPRAAQRPVTLNGVLRVAGTRGIKAAVRPEQRADEPAVERDEGDQERAHRRTILSQCDCRLARISALLLVVAAGRALTTTSRAGSSCWRWRNDSRARRLMRLRLTALPAALMPTASPSRAWPAALGRVSTRNSASEDR